MLRFCYGLITGLSILFTITLLAVLLGAIPSGADVKPPALETIAAKLSLNAAISRESKGLDNPLPPSESNLLAGVKTYAANCAVCHGAADAKPSTLAKGFYIGSPQLAKDGVEDDPEARTFVKMQHGIRFSAMPAFGSTLSEVKLWQLAAFLKRMDKLPPVVDAEWKKVPTASRSHVH